MMTNEEAIKMIKDDVRLHHDHLSGKYRKALSMAIEALSNSQNQSDSLIRTSADAVSEADVIYRADAIYHCRKRLYQTAEVNRPIEVYADIAENRIGEWLNELPSAQPEIIRCKECTYFEYDHVENVDGIQLIVAHEICNRWSDGVKTSESGFCFLAERRTDETD